MLETTISVSGTDHFLLALDQEMRKSGAQNYTCRFSVALDGAIDLDHLQLAIDQNPGLRWIYNARRKPGWPGQVSRWVSTGSQTPKLRVHQGAPDNAWFNATICDDVHPIRLDYFRQTGELFLSWLHTLMDAHGGEIIVKALASEAVNKNVVWLPTHQPDKNLSQQLQLAREAKAFLFEQGEGLLLERKASGLGKGHPSQTSYRSVQLSAEETQQVTANCALLGAKFRKSAFYLAACTRAFVDSGDGELQPDHFILVPVPQDRRKRGGLGPVVSNQVAFMFFRFRVEELGDLKALVHSATEQMMTQLRSGSLHACTMMMQLFRRLPVWAYQHVIKAPTKGKMASFYFSDTGNSLEGFSSFRGVPVRSAVHFPPNSFPPGFTCVFGMFKGCLQYTLAYSNELFSEADIDRFIARLNRALAEGQ